MEKFQETGIGDCVCMGGALKTILASPLESSECSQKGQPTGERGRDRRMARGHRGRMTQA